MRNKNPITSKESASKAASPKDTKSLLKFWPFDRGEYGVGRYYEGEENKNLLTRDLN